MKKILLLFVVSTLFVSCKKSDESPIMGMVALYEDAIKDVKRADNIIELRRIYIKLEHDLYNHYIEHKSALDAVADDIKDYGKDHEKVYSNPEEIDRLLAVQKDFEEICDAKGDELKRVGAEENYMMERFEDFYKMLRKHAEREASLNKDSIRNNYY